MNAEAWRRFGLHVITVDNALRSNCLIAVALGLITGERAQRCADAALHYLVVPGALRSLAPLPVTPHLPVHAPHGQLLNHPAEPYWGRYEGDEDTRRKPACPMPMPYMSRMTTWRRATLKAN